MALAVMCYLALHVVGQPVNCSPPIPAAELMADQDRHGGIVYQLVETTKPLLRAPRRPPATEEEQISGLVVVCWQSAHLAGGGQCLLPAEQYVAARNIAKESKRTPPLVKDPVVYRLERISD
jgi:hypothetical protein